MFHIITGIPEYVVYGQLQFRGEVLIQGGNWLLPWQSTVR